MAKKKQPRAQTRKVEPEVKIDEQEMSLRNRNLMRIGIYLFFVLIACLASGGAFVELRDASPVYPSSSMTKKQKLSYYLPSLKGTRGETEVLIFESRNPGGAVLVLGGTHPNEPAANVTAVLLAENLSVEQGKVIVIPRANASAFTATEPQEGFPQSFHIKNRKGRKREFKVGSRYTNMLDGWPDPIVYRHHPSGQLLSGAETRNLNRAYPGKKNGSLTEMIAYAITEVVRQEKVDIVIDLHEAAPEYPVINALVAHQRVTDIAAMATVDLEMRGVEIQLEVSPENFHGLSHREIGDFTEASVVLLETAGALQGRMRGVTNTELITKSKDPLYARADKLGKLAVPFPEEGIPIETRVGRHLESIKVLTEVYSEFNPDRAISYTRVPGIDEIKERGVGFYLR